MTTIRLSPLDIADLIAGKTIERVGGPTIKIKLEKPGIDVVKVFFEKID